MCFRERGGLVEMHFWENRKLLFWKMDSFMREHKNSGFLHTSKPQLYSKLSICPHCFPLSATPKITCSLPFNRSLAAASTHRNFDFPENPILRLMKTNPFAPVQSLKAVLDTNCFNHYQKHAFIELWTVPGSPEGRNPRSAFGYFSQTWIYNVSASKKKDGHKRKNPV